MIPVALMWPTTSKSLRSNPGANQPPTCMYERIAKPSVPECSSEWRTFPLECEICNYRWRSPSLVWLGYVRFFFAGFVLLFQAWSSHPRTPFPILVFHYGVRLIAWFMLVGWFVLHGFGGFYEWVSHLWKKEWFRISRSSKSTNIFFVKT